MDTTLAKPMGGPISLVRKKTNERIAVIGLGYVGLPLGIELSKKYETVMGFDIDLARVDQLNEIDVWGRLQHDGILMDIKSHLRNTRVPDGKHIGACRTNRKLAR